MLKRIIIGVICVATTVAQSSSTRQYAIDNNHSTIGFSISIMSGMSKVTGKFTDFAITLTNDEQDITRSSVNAVIKTASINTGIEARDKDLRSPAFFDAEKYPEITFQSSRIEKKGNQLVAFGTFTMHGVSKELALPFAVTGPHKNAAGDKMNFGYATRVTLNRRDFGINWRHKTVPDFVGDNVEVEIELITRAIDVK
jgi:polyisoprenoid-binding protein YceI